MGTRVRMTSSVRSVASAPRKSSVTVQAMKLYVGNLSWSTTQDDLYDYFGQYGPVEDAFVAVDRETGRSRGFGFVSLADADAQNAVAAHEEEVEFMGRILRVNEAAAREPRPDGGRGGGGFRGGRGGGGGYGGRGGGGGGGYGGGRGGQREESY